MGACFFKKKEETMEDVPRDFFALQAKDINGLLIPMSKYQEYKVILIVNVACKCAMYSSSYKNLNLLYEKYKSKGLMILAFPCD